MTNSRLGLYLIAALWLARFGIALEATAASTVAYNRDIRPILSDNCFACHGPDQNKRKAKLRLDVREDAIGRNAITPGKPDESELITRIFSTDPDELMPPEKSHKVLTAAQKELLRRWITEGAPYEGHWAFIPPARPATPTAGNAIDHLVRQRLSEFGLEPSPEADRRTLARRLYFDLIGLPPAPEDVAAFERDGSPNAAERLVDKLLASPFYGERMAIGWLDVVRYADTIGYHSDTPRNVWPYREYVIRAFNDNKPFDQFTLEQLAGDLLPNSTQEQKVASAFNRLLLTTEEGGAQPKDYEARMLTDRVRAVGTVWLGQTLGCAQCHDHKFDPITARDFYSMGAFFADIKEPIIGKREDGMLVPDANQAAELERLDQRIAQARRSFEQPRPELLAAWEEEARKVVQMEPEWSVIKPESAQSAKGSRLSVSIDGVITADQDPAGGTNIYRIQIKPGLRGMVGFRIEVLGSDKFPGHGPGRGAEGSFALTEFTLEDASGSMVELADATATIESASGGALAAVDGSIAVKNGWSPRGMEGVSQAIYFTTAEPIDSEGNDSLTLVLQQFKGANAVIGRFRISTTTNPEVLRAPKTTMPPREIVEIIKASPGNRTEGQMTKLLAYHRGIAHELADERLSLTQAEKAKTEFAATVPHCLVSMAAEKPRTVRLLPRGDWMNETGDVVEPALPVYLAGPPPAGSGKRLTRLDLADWLVSRENPLTARVVVNRLWKQFFGSGLSKVLDDFGAQGEPPPNQPLLDWLACEFVDSGWNVKHLVRLIVTSQTYRQSSLASKDHLARDPENRELARQSRWRLEAELVRDNALSIAGLLVTRFGGPSVKPYQPEGYWENLNFPVRTYEASKGEEQYRRGLYCWWQRSYLHPSFVALDAPTREECAADRSRSNIPQQALVLLNDPTYVESARSFAARILREGGPDASSRIDWAFRQTLSRPPRPHELQTMFDLLYRQLSDPKLTPNPSELLKVGQAPVPPNLDAKELAIWTNVARVLLNLHETITRS